MLVNLKVAMRKSPLLSAWVGEYADAEWPATTYEGIRKGAHLVVAEAPIVEEIHVRS